MLPRFAATGLLTMALLAGCNRGADPNPDAADPENEVEVEGKGGTAVADAGPRPETHDGRLEAGDPTLRTGEYADEYKVQVTAGQWLDARMTSSAFDPYLIVVAPSGSQEDNDDEDRTQGTAARVRMQATESGLYGVRATSFQPGESGAYTVTVTVSEGEGDRGLASGKPERTVLPPSASGLMPTPTPDPGDGRVERGTLAQGDETLTSGEFYDTYPFEGRAGERVTIDLTSSAFDPYLILWKPDGEQEDNDDFEGSTSHSRITMALPADGTYRIGATSYATGVSGAYELTIQQGNAQGRPPGK